MSNQSKIMGEVTNVMRFTTDFTKAKLIEHVNLQEYELTQEQLQSICNIVETSISAAYQRPYYLQYDGLCRGLQQLCKGSARTTNGPGGIRRNTKD